MVGITQSKPRQQILLVMFPAHHDTKLMPNQAGAHAIGGAQETQIIAKQDQAQQYHIQ